MSRSLFDPKNEPLDKLGNPMKCIMIILGITIAAFGLPLLGVYMFTTTTVLNAEVCSAFVDTNKYGRELYTIVTSEGTFRLFTVLKQEKFLQMFPVGSVVDLQLMRWNYEPFAFKPSILDASVSYQYPASRCPSS